MTQIYETCVRGSPCSPSSAGFDVLWTLTSYVSGLFGPRDIMRHSIQGVEGEHPSSGDELLKGISLIRIRWYTTIFSRLVSRNRP